MGVRPHRDPGSTFANVADFCRTYVVGDIPRSPPFVEMGNQKDPLGACFVGIGLHSLGNDLHSRPWLGSFVDTGRIQRLDTFAYLKDFRYLAPGDPLVEGGTVSKGPYCPRDLTLNCRPLKSGVEADYFDYLGLPLYC